ncbi:MAG TPA: hypothetical protein VGH36_00375 [Acetobacteraceae bacterium]
MPASSTQTAPPPARLVAKVPVPATELFAVITEYLDAGRLDAAERMLGHVLDATPELPDALHVRGLIAFRRGNILQADGTGDYRRRHQGGAFPQAVGGLSPAGTAG